MVSGPNRRTDYERLGPSKSGIAGAFPTLLEMAKGEMLGAHNILFQFSSCWHCNSNDGGGGAGSGFGNSLWNGATLVQDGTAGDTEVLADPSFTSLDGAVTAWHLMPILTYLENWVTGDYYNIAYLESSGILGEVTISCATIAGAAALDREFCFMLIGPRREGTGFDTASRTQSERAKAAMNGGVPTVAGDVIQ